MDQSAKLPPRDGKIAQFRFDRVESNRGLVLLPMPLWNRPCGRPQDMRNENPDAVADEHDDDHDNEQEAQDSA